MGHERGGAFNEDQKGAVYPALAQRAAAAKAERLARAEGKRAGIRAAADALRQWAETSRKTDEEAEALILEEAADNLGTIADRLEEEG